MRNYPVVLRNYLFLMGIFSTLLNDSEGTRTLSFISRCFKSAILLSYISHSLNLFFFSEKAFSEGSMGDFLYVNFVINEFSRLNITSIGRNLIQEEDDCAFACLKIPHVSPTTWLPSLALTENFSVNYSHRTSITTQTNSSPARNFITFIFR